MPCSAAERHRGGGLDTRVAVGVIPERAEHGMETAPVDDPRIDFHRDTPNQMDHLRLFGEVVDPRCHSADRDQPNGLVERLPGQEAGESRPQNVQVPVPANAARVEHPVLVLLGIGAGPGLLPIFDPRKVRGHESLRALVRHRHMLFDQLLEVVRGHDGRCSAAHVQAPG